MSQKTKIFTYLKKQLQLSEEMCEYVYTAIKEEKEEVIHTVLEEKHWKNIMSFFNSKNLNLDELKKIDEIFNYQIKNKKTKQKTEAAEDKTVKHVSFNNEEYIFEGKLKKNFEKILKVIKNNKITVLRGNTGIGKTTMLPVKLMDHFKNIVCTQPRRIAAITVAQQAAKLKKSKIWDKVGYAVRFDTVKSEKTKLLYMTDGLFIKQTVGNKNSSYDLIIIDEAHERSINIDILLGYLKHNLGNAHLLVMSATLESKKLIDYFNCPLITLRHKMHKVEEFYLESPIEDNFKIAIQTVIDILATSKEGNILVFMSGQEEIKKAVVESLSVLDGTDHVILPLYSSMSMKDQRRVFQKSARKIIFATNIAETSVTIENIKYVIDTGYVKSLFVDNSSVSYLLKERISKSQAKQRAGRAGRTTEGFVYHLYTKKEMEKFEENTKPAILRESVADAVLMLISFGISDIYEFDYIDKPEMAVFDKVIEEFYFLGILDKDMNLTGLGKNVSKLPLSYKMGISLFNSIKNGNFDKISTIFAFLECPAVFSEVDRFSAMKTVQNKIYKSFTMGNGKIYMFLSIFDQWKSSNFSDEFLTANFLKKCAMLKVKKIKSQLIKLFNFTGEDSNSNVEDSLCSGYLMNSAKLCQGTYVTLYDGLKVKMHYMDPLYKQHPKYVIFFELFHTNQTYIGCCCEINKTHLDDAANKSK
ncbi:prp22 [Nucleospora cyclopteri]